MNFRCCRPKHKNYAARRLSYILSKVMQIGRGTVKMWTVKDGGLGFLDHPVYE